MLPKRLFALMPAALGAAVLLTGCTPKFSQEDVDRSGISLAEVRTLVEEKSRDTLVLDARGPKAYGEGHIPGARQMGIPQFSGKYGETDPALEKYKTIVVYGDNRGSGSTSGLALRMMSTGYDNVRAFFEGFDAWKRAGLPIEADPAAAPAPKPEAEPKATP